MRMSDATACRLGLSLRAWRCDKTSSVESRGPGLASGEVLVKVRWRGGRDHPDQLSAR